LDEVVSVGPILIWAVVIDTLPIWPDVSMSHLVQIWMELLLFGQSWF